MFVTVCDSVYELCDCVRDSVCELCVCVYVVVVTHMIFEKHDAMKILNIRLST